MKAPPSDEVLRFRLSERRMHWAVAIPFMLCYTTALVLVFVYNPNPARPFREVVSWIHRLSGVCLALMPIGVALRHRSDTGLHVGNVKEAWTWTREDVKWLFLMGPATVSRRVVLPHQGKFNAAEKVNFMVLTVTFPLFVLTGLLIWMPGTAYLSWLVHLSLALITTPLILGHIFMATINPDTRAGLSGMVSGFVNREWARHHYRRWYDHHYGLKERVAQRVVQPPPAEPAREPDSGKPPETDASVAA